MEWSQKSDRLFWQRIIALRGAITPRVFPRVLIFSMYAEVVKLLYRQMPHLSLSPTVIQIVGGFIVLVLVFRVNSSYDKWWEGRKILGGVVNQARNLTLSILNFLPEEDSENLLGFTTALPFTIKDQLYGRQHPSMELLGLLGEEDFERMKSSPHTTLFVAGRLMGELKQLFEAEVLDPVSFFSLQEEIKKMVDYVGMCERIKNTPLPLVLDITVKRFVMLYLIVVPFVLVDFLSWFTTPIFMCLVAYPLLALEQVGVEIENPFNQENLGHHALQQICLDLKRQIESLKTEHRAFLAVNEEELAV